MQTDALIKSLAEQAEPVANHTTIRRLALAFSITLTAAIAFQLVTVGLRADLAEAWFYVVLKGAFCIGLATAWLSYVLALSAPGSVDRLRSLLAGGGLALVGVVAGFATFDFAGLQSCVSQVLLLAAPALAGLLWVVYKAAPVRPGLAGFAVGIAAGAIGAFAYSLGCLADAPTVVAFRYGGAILASGCVGMLIGKFALKW